jgi:hypothetical protein
VALFQKAFDAKFANLDDVLQQADMTATDYIELKWKPDMLEEKIVDLAYHRYWELWRRVWFVAGARHNVRLYALRVGAGASLDGKIRPIVFLGYPL